MYQTSFTNKTPSSLIHIDLKITTTTSNRLVVYENKCHFDSLCKRGCPNYNRKWSCPPFSPFFTEYSNGYPYILLILFSCSLAQFDYIKMEYTKLKASNSILKARMDKLLPVLEHYFDGKMISNGSCRLCNPCNKKVNDSSCKKPNKMRYSMESLGLNVEKISVDFFNHELLWYKNKKAPLYSSVVSCLLLKKEVEENILSQSINKLLIDNQLPLMSTL